MWLSKKTILLSVLLFFSQIPTIVADDVDDCPSVVNAAQIAQFNIKKVKDIGWRVESSAGVFFVSPMQTFCVVTMIANMSEFLPDLDRANDVWTKFDVQYGRFYESDGDIYLEQVAILRHGSDKVLAETLRFFDATAYLIVKNTDNGMPSNSDDPV